MSLLLTDGDEKPAAGEFFANIGRRHGGFLRGAVQTDFSHRLVSVGLFPISTSAPI
jgi:hypothetical protein